MRATAVYIKSVMRTNKRKAVSNDNPSKFLCINEESEDKENINKHDDNNNLCHHKQESPSCSNFSKIQGNDFSQLNALAKTKEIIQIICDTVKNSAKQIIPSFRRKNLPVLSSRTEKHSVGIKRKEKCFVEREFLKINLDNLTEYLKHKNSLLRRSKTKILPTHSVCSSIHIRKFIFLIEDDPMISLFLKRDICKRYADKYLLAMVLIYFARAQLNPSDFSRENFFAALYLAHDMEEDDEEMKYEVFPYCLGPKWRTNYTYLLSVRDDLFWALNCRAVVSRKCCEQVINLIPDHSIWERERPSYHADINRSYSNENHQPRGPNKTPLWCRACLEKECGDSDNSYIVYSSFSESSSEDDTSSPKQKDSGFESFLLPACDKENSDKEDTNEDDSIKTASNV